MRHFIIATTIVFFAMPAFATGGTGIGKGDVSTPTTESAPAPPPASPATPCKAGDTYDKWQDICVGKDGKEYLHNRG
jgi:hypothetical protein